MIIQMPSDVEMILETLEYHGYEAYIVGGCVRDALLCKEPMDWDITTSAKPKEVKEIFKRTIDTGIEHGTVTVMVDKEGYEITTYRIDGEYEDNRHPKEVIFTDALSEDLKRRDFTINAMAYNQKRGLVDLFFGHEDLSKGIIKCVGNPLDRFDEDALRILRAIRFSAQLGFQIHEDTQKAIRQKVHLLPNVSAERVRVELVKLLVSNHPDRIHQAYKLGITEVILPEYNQIVGKQISDEKTIDQYIIEAVKVIEPLPELRLAMLFHRFGMVQDKVLRFGCDLEVDIYAKTNEDISKKILKRLKFDNKTIDMVSRLTKWHSLKFNADFCEIRRVLNRVGEDIFIKLLQVQVAKIKADGNGDIQVLLADLDEKKRIYEEIIASKQCFMLKHLVFDGQDLLELGIPRGPLMGKILNYLLDQVIDDQSLNQREILREKALGYYKMLEV